MNNSSDVIHADQALTLTDIAQACGLGERWIVMLVDADILTVSGADQSLWRFESHQLSRARRAFRLHRDFEASLNAVALILDLLDELEPLRRRQWLHQMAHHVE